MPAIRSSTSEYCALLTSSITLDGEIISPYSCYTKKGLVYIIITEPFGHQSFFYSKYTKLNTCMLCNMRLVLFNKCIFFICLASL